MRTRFDSNTLKTLGGVVVAAGAVALVLLATHNPEIAAAMDTRIELRDGARV